MADTTVSVIQAGGGDYTSIAAAVAASDVSSGSYIIQLQDNTDHLTNNINFSPVTGTATSANRLVLESAPANRHQGVCVDDTDVNVQFARIVNAEPFGFMFTIESDFCVFRDLAFYRVDNGDNRGTDLSFYRVANGLVSNCLFYDRDAFDDYRIRTEAPSTVPREITLNIDHCVFAGTGGSRWIRAYGFSGTTVTTLNVDHCAIDGDSLDPWWLKNDMSIAPTSGGPDQINVYNTWFNPAGHEPFEVGNFQSSYGKKDLNGSHVVGQSAMTTDNVGGAAWNNNLTNFTTATAVTTDTTAQNIIITQPGDSATSQDFDATPLLATGAGNNYLLTTGTNRQGSEPDSWQDFSTDLLGNTRSTAAGRIDIGPIQLTKPAGFKVWDGAAFVDSSAVKHYDGAAWVEVSAVQYWNGSAWADPS